MVSPRRILPLFLIAGRMEFFEQPLAHDAELGKGEAVGQDAEGS